MKKDAPCKGCEHRTPSCHAVCEFYKEWRRALDERNEAARKRAAADKMGSTAAARYWKTHNKHKKKKVKKGQAMQRKKIIAVDFDGTLCENKYPEIGEPKGAVIRGLIAEQQKGAQLILWTCRSGLELAKAICWCAERGLLFDAINENIKSTVEHFGNDPRKICADEYWDDKAVCPFEIELMAENLKLKKQLEELKNILHEIASVIDVETASE